MRTPNQRFAAGWLSLLIIAVGLASPACAQALSGSALVDALRQGGYVLLMRHASSPHQPPDRGAADPGNTSLERQLDNEGKQTAVAMGRAIRSLGIPIGSALSSPTYRARETVRLAGLGALETYEQLGDGGRSMSPESVADWAAWLKERVAETPMDGTNTVIVTHMPNVTAAFPEDARNLADGEMLVFRPDGKGGAHLVAHIEIGEWPKLAMEN
jgi:phosphohistidine phosphatase SixA